MENTKKIRETLVKQQLQPLHNRIQYAREHDTVEIIYTFGKLNSKQSHTKKEE